METVSNIATQASKYLFGGNNYDPATQSGQEPRSGETGDVRRGEPYDAGNKDEPDVDNTGAIKQSTSDRMNDHNNIKDTTNYNTSSNMSGDLGDKRQQNNYTLGNSNANKLDSGDQYGATQSPRDAFKSNDASSRAAGANIDPAATMSNTTPGNMANADGGRSDNYADKMNSQPTESRSIDRVTDTPPSNAADNAGDRIVGDPSSGNQTRQKQQGADRPMDEPTGEEHEAVRRTKQNAEHAANDNTSGSGSMSLDEKATPGGGAVGAGAGPGVSPSGGAGGPDDKPQSESHGEGTGEKYVRSTGVKAEGGDFDAANPGAGREADRLLEEAGIHREGDGKEGKNGSPSPDRQGSDKGSKKGLAEKIKSKLHKH